MGSKIIVLLLVVGIASLAVSFEAKAIKGKPLYGHGNNNIVACVDNNNELIFACDGTRGVLVCALHLWMLRGLIPGLFWSKARNSQAWKVAWFIIESRQNLPGLSSFVARIPVHIISNFPRWHRSR